MNTTNVPKCYLLGMESISGGANWHGNSCLHDWHHSHLNFSNGHPSREPHNGHPHSPHSHDPPHRGGACLWWPHQPNRHILCCPCGPHLFLAGLYLHCGLVCWGPAWSPSTPGCGKSCHCGNLLSWGLYSHGRYTGPVTTGLKMRQALCLEIIFSFVFLFASVWMAFDARQVKKMGQVLVCSFVGLVLSLLVFISTTVTVTKGYAGAGINPARCFGPAIERRPALGWALGLLGRAGLKLRGVLFVYKDYSTTTLHAYWTPSRVKLYNLVSHPNWISCPVWKVGAIFLNKT